MSAVDVRPNFWNRSTLWAALLGCLLYWAALPGSLPLPFGWLGWFAPIPWLLLVRRDELPGRRPYAALWLAYFIFWLFVIHWIRLPHPALYLGWLALSAYMAVYLPVFVALTRVAIHRLRVPLWITAPVVWTGLELARAHLLTGFLMASLAHTQVHWTQLIQISDIAGEYGVDFLVMLVAACVTSLFRISDFGLRVASGNPQSAEISSAGAGNRQLLFRPLAMVPAMFAIGCTLFYGYSRLAESKQIDANDPRAMRIALIQGNTKAEWKADPEFDGTIMDDYIALSDEAVAAANKQGHPIDLMVWPETMFRSGLVTFAPEVQLPPGVPRTKKQIVETGPNDLAGLVKRVGAPVLVGVDRVNFNAGSLGPNGLPRPHVFNSAALVSGDGKIVGTYDKNHRVMFGEYIPFAEYLPFLYHITPLTGGIDPGPGPVVLELNDRFLSPSICYETVIPHVMRRQANTRVGGSVPADVLVNVTNDAWYRTSKELEQHLACGLFRTIETRMPLVIAAHGGISAWVDRTGVVRIQSGKGTRETILADVELGYMNSWYVKFGDWFAGLCLTCCVALAIIGYFTRRQSRQPPPPRP